ncbi:hypothetical protein [Flavobacterium frigoris]|uniref:Uncharacterized protein n=1 Tax=Flavobacterium frigoris TaxID=229204 RepID=A0A1H9SAD8_FLAFI|nr:hypothetical protein [Flavobacterium frigoris]SER81962.1 hypothetical protein SAMN05444355_1572 [Flavobacterium frigoris]
MKNISILFLAILLCQSCGNKNDLKNSLWKYCDDNGSGYVSDIIDFRGNKYLYVKNDTIFNKENLAVAIIDRIKYYYGERRLFVKDKKGLIARYCEQ